MSLSKNLVTGLAVFSIVLNLGGTAFARDHSRDSLAKPAPAGYSDDYIPIVNPGFDKEGNLRTNNTLMTYDEAKSYKQVKDYCNTTIDERVSKIGWVKLRQVAKTGFFEAIGSMLGLGAALLISPVPGANLGRAFAQVGLENFGGAAGGTAASVDEAIMAEIGAAKASCVLQMADRNPVQLGRVLVVSIPRLRGKEPKVLEQGAQVPPSETSSTGDEAAKTPGE